MASIGISDVVTASVYSEKTRMKKLMMMKMITIIIIIIMNKHKKRRFFTCARNWLLLWNKGQKSAGRFQIWCSIQLSLHKEPPEVGLVKKLTGSLYWWVEQCMPTIHRECYHTLLILQCGGILCVRLTWTFRMLIEMSTGMVLPLFIFYLFIVKVEMV